jgi:hypothetical protein
MPEIVIPTNPLTLLDNPELWSTQVTAILVCLRSRSAINRKHSKAACLLFDVLQLEAQRRGTPQVEPPYAA